ncbi:hypothetical protein DFH09DRAFT_1205155 [Mycena vulgaris]|nr:hypothetical protein DFH09DRAFT_1205155 [Mycena vulgaris]
MANRAPDEIISEILSPLLKHSDEVFSDASEKPLVKPGYSSSTYLLVCKAWLRISTPLLYSVVILRITAQATALEQVIKPNPEFGLFIKKLRIEGGFGQAMHTILKCAPNITDLFLTLSIWGSDNVNGLCRGLPLINPRRVILVDGDQVAYMPKPKKNKQVTQLLDTILKVVPKWDKLLTFFFPYVEPTRDPICYVRAESLASALSKSKTLETLLVCAGNDFPKYLRQMCDVPSLKSLHLTSARVDAEDWLNSIRDEIWLGIIRETVNADPKLKALVKYDDSLPTPAPLFPSSSPLSPSSSTDSLEDEAPIGDIQTLENLGDTSGTSMDSLIVRIMDLGSKPRMVSASPTVLSPFTALTQLEWNSFEKLSFSTPPPGFSALPNLHKLTIWECSPSFLTVLSQLSLDSLRDVCFKFSDVSASVNFLQRHGYKLLELSASIELLDTLRVFDVCTSLTNLVAVNPRRSPLPDDFIACDAPHGSLLKIQFPWIRSSKKFALLDRCTTLDKTNFPVLEEIQMACLQWPTSEHQIRNNEWVKLSDVLSPKGIKLTDKNGVGWTAYR